MGILSLMKPLNKYEDYVTRANFYESYFMRNKAIRLMNEAIEQKFTKEEKASGLIYLGIMYSKIDDYQQSSDKYNLAFEIMIDEQFKYSSNFKNAIKTFIKTGDLERASFWLDNFLQRQEYDKRFKKLSAININEKF